MSRDKHAAVFRYDINTPFTVTSRLFTRLLFWYHALARRATMPGNVVYASVEAVEVPPGTQPGASFTASIWRMRKGVRTAVQETFWAASGAMPTFQVAARDTAAGKRPALRPSGLARAATGDTSACAADHMVTKNLSISAWSTQVQLPFETCQSDVGWLPGPVGGSAGRPFPEFTGRAMGVRSHILSSKSSARQIMREIAFSRKYKDCVIAEARAHVERWQSEHESLDGIERAFDAARLTGDVVELWMAIEARHSVISPAVPADHMWDPTHWLYDAEVARVCPLDVYKWMNRHLSFGDGSGEAGGEADGDGTYDRHRKRREASDITRALPAKVWSPGQHLTLDDLVFSSRKGRRIRYKASVHSGYPCDALNCSKSSFFLNWEQLGWLFDEHEPSSDESSSAESEQGSIDDCNSAENGGSSSPGRSRAHAGGRGRGARGRGTGGGRLARGRRGGRVEPAQSRRHDSRGGSSADAADGPSDLPAAECVPDGCNADADNEFGAMGWSPATSAASGVNSLQARWKRARACVTPHVGHCIWADRGMANLPAMAEAVADGFHVSAIMPTQRVGLPRRALARLTRMMLCRKGCSHQLGDDRCNRFRWTCMHKGNWELVIMSDGMHVVVAMSSCTSAMRTVQVVRTIGRQNFFVDVPEVFGVYTIVGRGGTDTGDQFRRKLDLCARRRERSGPKGALFDAEIGFVDGTISASDLRATSETVRNFADEFATDVIKSVNLRRVETAAMLSDAASSSTAPTRAHEFSHRPFNFRREAARCRRAGMEVPKIKHGAKCCGDACALGEPQKATLFCAGCKRERECCNGWYHEACYWKRHKAVPM